jgi:hypothetical protein
MTGIERDGSKVEHTPRRAKPVPRGPLSHRQVTDLQSQIVKGLETLNYTKAQTAQVLNQSPRTASRRAAFPGNATANARPC